MSTFTTTAPLSAVRDLRPTQQPMCVKYNNQWFPADTSALYHAMVGNREPLEAQVALWDSFIDQYPERGFIAECLRQIDETYSTMEQIQLRRQRKRPHLPSACPKTGPLPPSSPNGTHRFTYHGDHLGLSERDVRSSLFKLVDYGMLTHDEVNLRNLLRLIGISHNEHERQAPIPWVRWNGYLNSLHCWIDLMHDAGIIGSGCGNDMRWLIAAGGFLDRDGHNIDHSRLSNSNQLSPAKRNLLLKTVPSTRPPK